MSDKETLNSFKSLLIHVIISVLPFDMSSHGTSSGTLCFAEQAGNLDILDQMLALNVVLHVRHMFGLKFTIGAAEVAINLDTLGYADLVQALEYTGLLLTFDKEQMKCI